MGVVIRHKVGDKIKKGEPLFVVHASDKAKLEVARARVLAAHKFSARPERPLPLFYKVIKSK